MAIFDRRFARHLAHLIRIYWGAREARWGYVLLATAAALEIARVIGAWMVADAERRLVEGLEARDLEAFLAAGVMFVGATIGFVLASAYRVYTRQAVEIRWRRSLTAHYVGRWITPRSYLVQELHGGVDNPQQRIQEDVREFVASALGLSLSLLAAVATLVSFGGFLYSLSASWPIPFTSNLVVPGLMLWVALGYAVSSMWVTHLVGRRLVPINYDRLQLEADFRYDLVHYGDAAATVALSRGETVEQRTAMARFRRVIANWWQLVRAQRNLTLTTDGIGQINTLVPILVAAPAYFARQLTLGSIVQARISYGQISGALGWFVFAYQEIARWRANVERLGTLSESLDATDGRLATAGIRLVEQPAPEMRLVDLRIAEPSGRVLLTSVNATIAAGDRVAITGPSGTGKTLLVRAIAGIWPFGQGRIEVPRDATVLFVPQWPYIPIGTLRAVLSYPAEEGTFRDADMRDVLLRLELARFATRLDDTEAWEQLLSPHEQQQLAMVRVLLQKPGWVFLDKATSALDDVTEKRVYDVLHQMLPAATVVTVAHRAAVADYHGRRWTIVPAGDEAVLTAA